MAQQLVDGERTRWFRAMVRWWSNFGRATFPWNTSLAGRIAQGAKARLTSYDLHWITGNRRVTLIIFCARIAAI